MSRNIHDVPADGRPAKPRESGTYVRNPDTGERTWVSRKELAGAVQKIAATLKPKPKPADNKES